MTAKKKRKKAPRRRPAESEMSERLSFEQLKAVLFIAFGQGTNGVNVAPSAVNAVSREYRALSRRAVGSRDGVALREQLMTLEYARALGRLASHNAIARGKAIIYSDEASLAIRQMRDQRPDIDCDICPFP